MPNKVVLDSSVIATMFFKEEASQRALNAVIAPDLITLDLAVAEVGNVAWKQVVLSGEDKDLALAVLQKCLSFILDACNIIRSQDLVAEAFTISVDNRIAFYDSLFLAAADRENVPLLTLDRKLYNKMNEKMDVRMV
jgi:predicted nucleic acid-binding protein